MVGLSGSTYCATSRVISSRFGAPSASAARCSFAASAEGIRTKSAVSSVCFRGRAIADI